MTTTPNEPAAPAPAATAPASAPATVPAAATPPSTTQPAAPAAPTPAATVQVPATPPAAPAASAEPTAQAPQGRMPRIEGEFDPERAKSTIANLRGREAQLTQALAEQKKQFEEFTLGVARLLGLAPDETPDPEKLTQQLHTAQGETRAARVELAVYRAAGKHGADPDAVLDSRAFQAAVANLDPAAADFAAQIDAALAAAVESNPRLRAQPSEPVPATATTQTAPATPAAPPVGVSGAPITAPTEGGPITVQQLAEASARGDHALIAKWHSEGRLNHLL